MKKAKKFLWWTLAILVVILALFIYWQFYFTYSEGYRAGLLQKISYKGNLVKTYEGELILSSIESTRNTAIASEKFLFSVPDKRVADQAMKLEGYTVTVHYRETHGRLFWRGDSKYLVDSISVMK
jgi:PDZ domain-containing secreted protein